MASYHDLLDAIARVRSVTGDPDAWKKGLTSEDVTTALNPASPPAAFGAILAKVTAAHPEAFLAESPAAPSAPPPRAGEGAAAEAIRDAEAALARQNTDAAHVDLQVVTAVLNAHAAHDDGLAELIALQRDIEHAVVTRTDLDTPAGAREFQRFLIGKVRDIRDVVENSSLDATSKASLAAALATLYASSTPDPQDSDPAEGRQSDPQPPPSDSETRREAPAEAARGAGAAAIPSAVPGDPAPDESRWLDALDPLSFEPVWSDPPLPDLPAEFAAAPTAPPPAAAVAPPAMPLPTMTPQSWGTGLPGGLAGGAPFGGSLPALGGPLAPVSAPELPRADGARGVSTGEDTVPDLNPEHDDAVEYSSDDDGADDENDDENDAAPADGDATTVDLPGGDTVTAPSPALAAAITAAVGGTPIPDAFRLQGITIPAPGTPVATPLDPVRLAPGDIGLFTDRHALALGNGTMLLDKQIQPIDGAIGPGFIGWQNPPEPELTTALPDIPAPNRAAATAPS